MALGICATQALWTLPHLHAWPRWWGWISGTNNGTTTQCGTNLFQASRGMNWRCRPQVRRQSAPIRQKHCNRPHSSGCCQCTAAALLPFHPGSQQTSAARRDNRTKWTRLPCKKVLPQPQRDHGTAKWDLSLWWFVCQSGCARSLAALSVADHLDQGAGNGATCGKRRWWTSLDSIASKDLLVGVLILP